VTDVAPFRALRYDPKRVELSKVLVPPYDVISREDRVRLYDRDPHSAIRLELTRHVEEEAGTDYRYAADRLERWQRERVLVKDEVPALYALRQRFVAPDGSEQERLGFFGLLRLEDYARRVVRPHERTMSGPKADRLKLLRATRANLSGVFCLYEDRDLELNSLLAESLNEAEPVRLEGVEHTLFALRDPDPIARVRAFLAEQPVVIADGHHRYETALAYRDARLAAEPEAGPDAPFQRTLAYFANAFAPGSLLLPIHRVVKEGPVPSDEDWRERLPGYEETDTHLGGVDDIEAVLARHLAPLADRHAFAADDGSGRLRIFTRAADQDLSVRRIHREVLEGVFGLDDTAVREGAVEFPKSARQAAAEVRAGRGAVALYLNPLTPEDVFRVTAAGELLPQKSTFFYPKLPTGILFRLLEDAT
jgi:uncharacterized protein (DUF1015 family)